MINFTVAYQTAIDSISYDAAFVVEIIWADGSHGVEGHDDIYIGTCDVSEIPAFPYPHRYMPYLNHDSISTVTERFNEKIGNSTIGTLKFSVLDKDNNFSSVIRRAEADTGQSIRRQRVELYAIVRGGSWADRVKVRTLNISSMSRDIAKETVSITAQSILHRMRRQLFLPKTSILAADVAATGAVSIVLADAADFTNPVIHSTLNDGVAVGFIKIDKEIMMWTSKASNTLTVPAAGRAMFGTTATGHSLNDDVGEVAVLKGNPFYIGMTIMTSGNGEVNSFDILPEHWGLGFDYSDTPSSLDIDYTTWETVGLHTMGYDGTRESGIEREFVFSSGIDGKTLIEKHILLSAGCFGRTLGDGRYSCKAMNRTPSPAIDVHTNRISSADVNVLLTEDDIISVQSLKLDMQAFSPYMKVDYYPSPRDTKDYTRHAVFADTVAEARHGKDGKLTKWEFYGLLANSETVNNIYSVFNAMQSRYASPPVLATFELMPRHHGIEVGDIVGVDHTGIQDIMLTWKDWSTHLSDWVVEHAGDTAFSSSLGDRLLTLDNDVYVCVQAGISGAAEPPVWGGDTVADGTIIWHKYDGHLSRAFEVQSISWNIKTGKPAISCISQPEKPSFFNQSAAAGYRYSEIAYQNGIDLGTLVEFTVTGGTSLGYTATQNAPVSLSGKYYFRGDIMLNDVVTLTSHTEIYAASDGTTVIGDITGTSTCSINGSGFGSAGGSPMVPDMQINYPGGFIWVGSFIIRHNGQKGFIGIGGNGGNVVQNGVPLAWGGAGGTVTNSSNDLIRVLGTGPAPHQSFSGLPLSMSGAGGGAGGVATIYGTPVTGGSGGNGGAGLVLIARGVDISAASVDLSGGIGTAGTVAGYSGYGHSMSGGGGGGGSLGILVERNSSGTQTFLYEPSRINISGGGVSTSLSWYPVAPQFGGTGAIIAQVF